MAIRKYNAPTKTEPTFSVLEECGTISVNGKYSTRLTLMSWNDGVPKYNIRSWNDEKNQPGKGIALTGEELEELYHIIGRMMEDTDAEEGEENE